MFKNGITLHQKERLTLRDKRCSPQLDSRFQAFSLDSYNFCLLCSPSSACLRVYSVLKSSMQNSNWWNWVGLEQLTSTALPTHNMWHQFTIHKERSFYLEMYHCYETIKSDKDQNDIALKAQLICYFSSFEDRTTTAMILFFLLLILLSTEANLIRIVSW